MRAQVNSTVQLRTQREIVIFLHKQGVAGSSCLLWRTMRSCECSLVRSPLLASHIGTSRQHVQQREHLGLSH